MGESIPKNTLVALSESPEAFARGEYRIYPAEEAKVSAFDRSFHFGDSIYEVCRSYEGVLFGLEDHMERMKASLALAAFEEMPDFEVLGRMVRDACRAWVGIYGEKDVYARWMVSRGVGDLNIGRAFSSPPYGFAFVKPVEAPTAEQFEKGYHYALVGRARNHPRALDPRMKSGNYINNVLAFAEARALGAQDAVLLDLDGHVTEGTTNNVYMVKGGRVLTAPGRVGILEGITRRYLMGLAGEAGIEMGEALITAAEFAAADELFMSSSIKEVMPITTLNGKPVGGGKPGPVTRRLAQAYKELVARSTQKGRHESFFGRA